MNRKLSAYLMMVPFTLIILGFIVYIAIKSFTFFIVIIGVCLSVIAFDLFFTGFFRLIDEQYERN